MGDPNYAAACVYVMERLTRELDSRFLYHGVAHTRDDVLPAVERLAIAMGVTGIDLVLLRTAALCHDTGFLVARADHEMRSVQFVEQELPWFGYTAAEIAQVGVIILATRLPQAPQTVLGQILADADLDLLGRDDFVVRNQELRLELAAFGTLIRDRDWYVAQLDFVRQHRYWTEAARQLRDAQKQVNISLLQQFAASA